MSQDGVISPILGGETPLKKHPKKLCHSLKAVKQIATNFVGIINIHIEITSS